MSVLVNPSTMISMRTLLVRCLPSTIRTSRTWRSRQRRFASGIGIATRSRRFIATPGRFFGVLLPERFSFQRISPTFHNASACMAEVLPELFGPMKTTGLPNSISTSPKHLKLLMVSFVSISSSHSVRINSEELSNGVVEYDRMGSEGMNSTGEIFRRSSPSLAMAVLVWQLYFELCPAGVTSPILLTVARLNYMLPPCTGLPASQLLQSCRSMASRLPESSILLTMQALLPASLIDAPTWTQTVPSRTMKRS